MLQPYSRSPEYITTLADGTIKQLNPFSGVEVWTVPGRANRPLGLSDEQPYRLDPADAGRHCAFCEQRYAETPPEKSRMVSRADGTREVRYRTPPEALFDTVADFRRVPNLFEILSYDYWHRNYGYVLPGRVQDRKQAYLDSPVGLEHVLKVVAQKLAASGKSQAQIDAMTVEDRLEYASGFFGGGHDVLIARRHFVDGATMSDQLASSGTLTPDEHYAFLTFTIESIQGLFDLNRYARYVAAFQNWLKPAGATFDHLHKQLVAIDERGVQHEAALLRLRQNPNIFNEAAVNYASLKNLVIAENEHAIAFAGFGHRFPSLEIYSKSEHSNPWEQSPDEVHAVSDLLHACHAATGAGVACNEEWHYRPIDVALAMPWRIVLKWRVSTLAGFEGATKIYVNTISPNDVRDRVVDRLFALRGAGSIADVHIAFECEARLNSLRYHQVSH